MTENMKTFLEAVSGDKAFIEKLEKAKDFKTVIALGEERGFTLTEEDLKPDAGIQNISDDEVEAVAGGKVCVCVVGGGGEASPGEGVCACVIDGFGFRGDYGRCSCLGAGYGNTNTCPQCSCW